MASRRVHRSVAAGQTALVTGASSGIGRALAIELGRRGVRVGLVGRSLPALQAVADSMVRLGAPAPVVLPADLSQAGAAAQLADAATRALGQVDILVNNAAVGLFASVCAGADGAAARELFETNYFSPMALMAALVPAMQARGAGSVINVASIAATMPPPMSSHYASAKGALALATEALRMELHGSGVHVLLVLPGPVDTAMLAEGRVVAAAVLDGSPRGSPAVLAQKIVAAIERRRTVLVYPLWAGLTRWLPTLALAIARRVFRRMPIEHRCVIRAGSTGDPAVRAERLRHARLAGLAAEGGAS